MEDIPNAHHAALRRLTGLASKGGNLTRLFHRAAVIVAETLSVDLCKVLEKSPDGNSLLLRAGVGWREGLVGQAIVALVSETHAGQTLLTGSPVIIEDLRNKPCFRESYLLHGHGVTSGAGAVIPGAEPFGVVGVYTTEHRSFSNPEMQFLQQAAAILGQAVRSRRASPVVHDARSRPPHPAASESRYEALFEDAAILVCTFDLDGRITSANRAAESYCGYTREELAGMDLASLLPPDQRDTPRALIQGRLRGGGTATCELDLVAPDGWKRPVQITFCLIEENGGAGVLGIAFDISERRRAQAALHRIQEQSRALIENAQDLITILGVDGTIRFVSPSIAPMLGYRPEERVGRKIFDIVHPDDLRAVRKAIRAPGLTAALELRIRHQNGTWRHLDVTARNALNHPAVGGIVVNARDITDRKLAEENLRAGQEWFRSSFERSGVATAISSIEGHFLRVNPAMCRFLGRSQEELIKLSWVEVTHPQDRETIRAARDRIRAGQIPSIHLEERFLHRDGSVLWGALTLSFIHDANQRSGRIVEQIVNITDRKKAEEERSAVLEYLSNALQRAVAGEERFRLAAESTADVIYEWDMATGRMEWFGEADECLGYRKGRFPRTAEAWKARIHPGDLPLVTAAIQAAIEGSGDPPDLEYRIRTRTGAYRYWLSRGQCIRDRHGNVRRWIGACTDITLRRQTDEQLRRSGAELRALAAWLLSTEEEQHRNLARELHEDFNQRLASFSLDLAKIQQTYPGSLELQKKIETVESRLGALSDDIRRLAHRLHPPALELLGVRRALLDLCLDASRRGPCTVRFVDRKLPHEPSGDIALCLYRIAQESIRNVIRHAQCDMATVTLSAAGQSIRLSIKDDGVGFDPDAFRPTGGLGLISMTERARLAGGSLTIRSGSGRGTHVVVEVPLCSGSHGPNRGEAGQPAGEFYREEPAVSSARKGSRRASASRTRVNNAS
jgi:PAS domain S-box-containing protein